MGDDDIWKVPRGRRDGCKKHVPCGLWNRCCVPYDPTEAPTPAPVVRYPGVVQELLGLGGHHLSLLDRLPAGRRRGEQFEVEDPLILRDECIYGCELRADLPLDKVLQCMKDCEVPVQGRPARHRDPFDREMTRVARGKTLDDWNRIAIQIMGRRREEQVE